MIKCPYCGAYMDDGVLQSGGAMAFCQKPRLLAIHREEGDFRFPFAGPRGWRCYPARYCRSCKKITISLEEKEELS